MAFKPSLRSRRSLIWEIRDISQSQKESPVFSLLNSTWKLLFIPVYEIGKVGATSYNIKLKKCSEIQSFTPFEVATFLQDRRNNVQVHCSKLIVSSPCETLFKSRFHNTYEKLPGLKIYDDAAIVCTFYPSTGLYLGTQPVKGSSLRIRHSVVWKTRKPTINRQKEESPLFNVKNSKWKLAVKLKNVRDHIDTYTYSVSLGNFHGIQPLHPFEIETYLFDRRNFENVWCSRLLVSSSFEILYKTSTDTLYEKLPGLEHFDDIIIVCAFSPPIGTALNDNMENDIIVSMEYSQIQNPEPFFQSSTAECLSPNASALVKFSSDFENLSKDFRCLLDNSFMSDIKLECGGDVINAHKSILAARSPDFAAVLKPEIIESSSITVELKDIEPLVLRELLEYLYCGTISIDLSEDMLYDLYAASDNYSVNGLKKVCSGYMTRSLNAENFIKFLILADKHNDLEMVVSIAGFITENSELLLSPNWVKFSDEFPRLANEIYRKHLENALKNKCSLTNS